MGDRDDGIHQNVPILFSFESVLRENFRSFGAERLDFEVCVDGIKELLIVNETLTLKFDAFKLLELASTILELKDVEIFHVALIAPTH